MPEKAAPPAWVIAVVCLGAAVFLGAVASRRGRACLRVRARLAKRSAHGKAYLEGFAVSELLFAAWSAAIVLIPWGWGDLTLAALLWTGRLPDLIAVSYVFVRVHSFRVPLGEWGWQRGGGILRELSIGVAAGLGAWVIGVRLVQLVHRALLGPDAIGLILPRTISTVVLAPIFEETLYRGALYRYLRDRLSWFPTVVFSSVVFAFMHSFGQMPFAFVGGLLYAFLREWRRSLIAPIAAHATWNLLATAAAGVFS